MATKMNCAWPAGAATAIQERFPRAAPISGSVACVSASSSARINANCPISGTIVHAGLATSHSGVSSRRPRFFAGFAFACLALSIALPASGGM